MAGTAPSSRTGGDGVEGAAINRNSQSYSCPEQSFPFLRSHEARGMPSSRPAPAANASGRLHHLSSPFTAYLLTFTNYPSPCTIHTDPGSALPWNLPAKYFFPALPLGLHQDILMAVFAFCLLQISVPAIITFENISQKLIIHRFSSLFLLGASCRFFSHICTILFAID